MSASLLARLPADWQRIFEGKWMMFERRVESYGSRVLRDVDAARRERGRDVAIGVVERWMADDEGHDRRLELWRRDRLAACAYDRLGEPVRAARHLRASLVTHHCGGGSCWFAPEALQFLYLQAGEPFKAGLTARSFTGQRGPAFGPPFRDFLTTAHLRRLVVEVVALHRDAPADPQVGSLIDTLRHEAPDVRATALRTLERLGPASSPALLAAARSCAPETRDRIDALLGDWALTHAAERLFPPDRESLVTTGLRARSS